MQRGCLQVFYEFLFSLNIALAFMTALILGSLPVVPFARLAFFVNRQLGRKAMNAAGGYVAFLLFVAVFAAVLVLVLWLLRRTAVARAILLYAGGFLAIGLGPVCWFYITHWYGWYPIEVLISIFCGVLYLVRKWPVPTFGTILLVAIHYGLWGWQFWWETRHNVCELLLPIIGFLSCVVWGVYVRAQTHGTQQVHAKHAFE